MQTRFGFLRGSLLPGAIWGLWHLPLWIIPGDPHIYMPFPVFVIFTMAFSVRMLWLFELSGDKLLVPWIMHGVQNTVLVVLPVYRLDAEGPQSGLFLYVGLNIAVAASLAAFRQRR